jgi:16S rRNA (cytidine1402-2'-O)-methyltransferase
MLDAQSIDAGQLFIVATPIGNLADISQRAIACLNLVDLIIAEDTRHSQKLLGHLLIKKPIVSFHAHNEHTKANGILSLLEQGKKIALISDAGTPLISDPGYTLVKGAREKGITTTPIPGPCALITALSASGLACDSFLFLGFLPAKQGLRQKALDEISAVNHTLVFYESSHRIVDSLADMAKAFGEDRIIVLAKELTKTFETFIQGTAPQIIAWLEQEVARQKGEFVLIVNGAKKQKTNNAQLDNTLKLLLEELPVKKAAKLASKILNCSKNDAYQRALTLKNQ